MTRILMFSGLAAAVLSAAVLAGCSQQQAEQQPAPSPEVSPDESAVTDHEGHDHEGHDHEGHDHEGHMDQSASPEHTEALAKLSPADRQLAEKQKICPVSGQPLGSMGTPYKVTVEGKEVLLCCSGCEAEVKENPEKYLAKLDQ